MSSYEFDGKKYRKASNHQKEWGNKLIMELPIKGNECILDLGCGDGTLTKVLADLVPAGKVIGIDSSVGMIEAAKELEGPNLTFLHLDIDEMNFINSFDYIFSNAALHWVLDHEKLLNNCYNALKSNGIIRFSFGGHGNCANLNRIAKEVINYSMYQDYFKNFKWPWYMPDVDTYKNLISKTSFGVFKVWEEIADRNFNTAGEIIRWIDQPCIVPFLHQLPHDKKKEFRDIAVVKILRSTLQPDGRYFETFRRINVIAKKCTK